MILLIGPVIMALAVLAIVTPRLFGVLLRLGALFVVLCVLYIIDGQQEHPMLPHAYEKSAAVR